MVVPLLPFYATRLGANGFAYTMLVSAFSLATLLSAPLWGRFSDRYGRRPALLIALGASAVSYVIFAYAESSRHALRVAHRPGRGRRHGRGRPGIRRRHDRAEEPGSRPRMGLRGHELGVAIGPLLGSGALVLGMHHLWVNGHDLSSGQRRAGRARGR